MKLLPLHNRAGEVVAHAKVDDEDFEWLSQWTWRYHQGYAARGVRRGGRSALYRKIFMHSLICPAPPGLTTDHRDRDKLNNTRANLRPATQTMQVRNTGRRADNSSGYIGVYRVRDKWRATIAREGRTLHLGYHPTAEAAAQARARFLEEERREAA